VKWAIVWITGTACALATAFGALPAHAQGAIQKCVGANGKVTYQDTKCATGEMAGEVQRDSSGADPVALQRARDDQERADKAAERRARVASAEEKRRDTQPIVVEQESAPSEPQYIYVGSPQPAVVVVRETSRSDKRDGRNGQSTPSNPRSAGTTPVPSIMQSPAPCNTVQCRKK
jgi:hypothetical protein